MKVFNRKLMICLTLIAVVGVGALSALPANAKVDGTIMKSHFYDTEKTIMPEVSTETSFKTGKYWEKNLFFANKYRPLFMLSNKDLYSLMPEKRISVVQRITTPSIYNISLKSSSIKSVSLSPKVKKAFVVPKEKAPEKIANVQMGQDPLGAALVLSSKIDIKSRSIYEQAKNQGTEPEQKTDAAILLKNTKSASSYTLALDLLNDVTKAEPYNAYAYYLKGEIYFAKRDQENAMKNYAEALKLNPSSKQCCLGIAKALEPTNKDLAQKYYDKAK